MRIDLKGKGNPIPLEAMPSPGASDMPPIMLNLPDGSVFEPLGYLEMGYTHYNAWCIGAAGGQGASVSLDSADFTYTDEYVPMSPEDWALYQELTLLSDGDHRYSYGAGTGGPHGDDTWTPVERLEVTNPDHLMRIRTYNGASLYGADSADPGGGGGAGGGGGLHLVSGLLNDLPETLAVSVGSAGVDALSSQKIVDGLWTPLPEGFYRFDLENVDGIPGHPWPPGSPTRRLYELYNYFNEIEYLYPEPRTSFPASAESGWNGGTSSLGDICRASGGKGGAPSAVWVGDDLTYDGSGGEGGVGDSVDAGGGAMGSSSEAEAASGGWDGIIGEGGGGGRGGIFLGGRVEPYVESDFIRIATNGGVGSFSYGDTSYYGAKGTRQLAIGSSGFPIIPGFGGGAKVGLLKYGAKNVPSFNPNGAVLVQLTKVE